MPNKYKTGDIIILRTGSHSMTIKWNATAHTLNGNITIPDRYECVWFDGKKSQKAVFKEDEIKLR